MPLFGLLPYDDEEERRRRMLTPPINPNAASELPTSTTPRPRMLPPPVGSSAGMPGGMPSPSPPPLGRRETLDMAKDFHMRETPGRGKSALKGALQGFLGGGGLGGALAGGIYGAADPRGLREMEFERKVQPKIMAGFGLEDQERAMQRQAERDELDARHKTAQIGELESQAYKNRLPPPAPAPQRPISSPRGLYDPGSGGIIPGTEPLPPQPRELAPRPVLNERGEYVDFNAETKAGRKVKAFQKPKAAAKPKKEAKVVSRSQVEKAADEHFGGDDSEAAAAFVRKGYRIIN